MNLFLHYVLSVSYLVVLNGEAGREFSPRRGLRQGDPFSPYIFLICCERLSSLMRHTNQDHLVCGARISWRGP